MKKILFLITFAACSFGQSACNSGSNTSKDQPLSERELLHKEVMEIHDAVMPKMSNINLVARKLKEQLANAGFSDSLKTIVEANISALNLSEQGMMDWMRDFSKYNSIPEEKAIEFLNDEKIRISAVSDQMLSSLESGNELLKQLENQEEN